MMERYVSLAGVGVLVLSGALAVRAEADCARYVKPFTGTAYNGHTFPGATMPFGAVQASPDTGWAGWQYCSGYRWDDTSALGFSQNHLNGTGCPDFGDFLIQPFVEGREGADFRGHYVREDQLAVPGYYGVTYTNFNIKAEVTASEYAAFYRFTYHGEGRAAVLLDTQHGIGWDPGRRIQASEIADDGAKTVWGEQVRKGWVTRKTAFHLEFDRPFVARRVLPKRNPAEKGDRFVYDFDLKPGEVLRVKVALSATSAAAAKANLSADMPGWRFCDASKRAYAAWNEVLSRVTVEGDEDQKANFYTSLYHLYIQPNRLSDAGERPFYSTFSCWDTFRAAGPLYTILTPEQAGAFVDSLLEQGRRTGYLPIWTLAGHDNQCMIGTHSIPMIVDGFLKGGAPKTAYWEAAYAQIKETLTQPHADRRKENWDLYDRYGYYPFDLIRGESASRTFECAYDDWCAAVMAEKLGEAEDVAFFRKRAGNWRNVFDTKLGFARGKDSQGNWREPFSPFALGHDAQRANDFTEGNAWHYTWHVMQDPEGLIAALGGKAKAAEKLASMFVQPEQTEDSGFVADATGLIGQYAHGNEPSHHTIYFFQFMGRGDLTATYVREVFDRFYLNKPDGLCGNDDCGQMSAWYVFSAMGFYPFNPCGGDYILGAPQLPKITLKLAGGKTFTVVAKGLSKACKLVKSVTLNGRPLDGFVLKHADVMQGGELVFEMKE